jgi:hypothetical protein
LNEQKQKKQRLHSHCQNPRAPKRALFSTSGGVYLFFRSQSHQTLISSFFLFLLLSLAISKYRQYFLMLQTLKLNNKKGKKYSFCEEKCLVGLTPGNRLFVKYEINIIEMIFADTE